MFTSEQTTGGGAVLHFAPGAGVKELPGFIHVVDDDASFRKAMERRLKQAGYEVATYPSALHLLVNLPAESIPSCILLDVRIPGLDGPGLQKRLSRTRLNAADHIPHRQSRHPDHGAGYQGGCG